MIMTMRSLGTILENFSLPDLVVSPRLTPRGLPVSGDAGVRVPVRDRLQCKPEGEYAPRLPFQTRRTSFHPSELRCTTTLGRSDSRRS